MEKLTIIKIGGNVINDELALRQFLADFSKVEGKKILVHGGGKIATEVSSKLGVVTKMHEGRRITTAENLDVVVQIYAGLINKNVVAQLQKEGCNAIGLTGADGNSILAVKRPVKEVDFGFVGDVVEVNSASIHALLENDMTPVFCAVTHNKEGQLLNTNADTIAAELAIGMSELYDTELVYCFEKNGVLMDMEDDHSVIPIIDSAKYEELKKENIIHEGMLPKMENCFEALQKNVGKVIIGNANALRDEHIPYTTLTL